MKCMKNLKFLNSLPMPVGKFIQLFDYLDKSSQGCKRDLQLTIKFLEKHKCPIKDVTEWLYKNDGGCDCAVLATVFVTLLTPKCCWITCLCVLNH